MDLKEFISSGIIESYVLGSASNKEQQEVERMAKLAPEVADAISKYEKTLEKLAFANAVNPPEVGKNQFLNAIEDIEQEEQKETFPTSKEIPIDSIKKTFVNRAWRITAVAATILFLISIGVNLFMVLQYNSNKEKTKEIAYKKRALKQQNQKLKAQQKMQRQKFVNVFDSSTQEVILKGVNNHSTDMKATIFWNKENNTVYLGKLNLPAPPSGKAYQLWAIIAKKPVDMGMYNPQKDKDLKTMKVLPSKNVSAFAITLEEEGGSKKPTMEQMYVMGAIS